MQTSIRHSLMTAALLALGALGPALAAPAAETNTGHHAVTLVSSFDPIPESLLPRDIKGQVYRTQSTVFGRTIYFVRLGFYATAGEAVVVKEQLLPRYPAAHVTEVLPEEYLRVTGGKPKLAPTVAAKPVPAVAAAPVETAIPAPPPAPIMDTPRVSPEPVPTSASVPETKPSVATTATEPLARVKGSALNEEALKILEKARDALTRSDNAGAIQLLSKLLRLPPNQYTPDGLELIGLAHERERELTAARREYTQLLQRYPEWSGAERVRQRLAALEVTDAPLALKKSERTEARGFTVNGSLSQHYYYGQSQIDSTTTVLGPATNSTFDDTDQSALISNLDLRGRYRSGEWDNRIVIRDTYNASFLDDVDSTNRLYSAYYELTNKVSEYTGRFGRQPGTSGGVLGRFDGLALGYNVAPKWRVNLVAGTPVDFYSVSYSKSFWGTSVDFGLFANHWNGSVYYMQQTVDGIADRQAVGTELRFFDPKGSALLYLDYDTLFGELNIATFQATWLSSPATTWNTLVDHRRAPTLMTSNALSNTAALSAIPNPDVTPTATQAGSISYWLKNITEEQLRQAAVDYTPTLDTYMLGVAHNLNTTWQIGGDVRRYSLSALPTSTTVITTLGTGATIAYTVQAIANGLFRKRDLSVLSLSLLDGETYTGETISFTQRMLFGDNWSVDLALSYYQQAGSVIEYTDLITSDVHTAQSDTRRLAPALRLGYRWRKNVTFETELGMETGTTHSVDRNITVPGTTTTNSDNTRTYFMLGYRWDF